MPKSEIFDIYTQIALENNLISEAEDNTETKKYKDDNYPRMGSDDISVIEALYGVKPDGQNYDYNIIEEAHPNSVVISPSHDKMNGLFENNNERNNIMVNLTLKPNDGLYDIKLAKKDLMMELIKIANHMDASNKENLRALADDCLTSLEKKSLEKTAFLPFVAGAAAVLATIYLAEHVNYADEGLKINAQRSMEKLDSLIDEGWFDSSLASDFKESVLELKNKISSLNSDISDYNRAINSVQKPRSLDELTPQSLKLLDAKKNEVMAELNNFKQKLLNIEPMIISAISNYNNEGFKARQTLKKSWLSDTLGNIGKLFQGGNYSLIVDKFKKAALALSTFENSIKETLKEIDNLGNKKEEIQQQVSENLQSNLFQNKTNLLKKQPQQNNQSPGSQSKIDEILSDMVL